jgi:hypothetical protein
MVRHGKGNRLASHGDGIAAVVGRDLPNIGDNPPVRLALKAAELEHLPLFNPEHLRPTPDHWNMPVGFHERDLFVMGGAAWLGATLPFEPTSSAVSGTPAYVEDKESAQDPAEPDIARGWRCYTFEGQALFRFIFSH